MKNGPADQVPVSMCENTIDGSGVSRLPGQPGTSHQSEGGHEFALTDVDPFKSSPAGKVTKHPNNGEVALVCKAVARDTKRGAVGCAYGGSPF